jgi:pyruvate/2-oxoglutarate dehydrogenase complex dihydrolipoamide dehydrogenase (E3) component
MAQAFARFGSDVFLIESMHGILPREDSDASGLVLESIQKDGVKLLCCGKHLEVAKADGKRIRFKVQSHGRAYEEVVDHLLVAVGRAPNVEGLGLEDAGVDYS